MLREVFSNTNLRLYFIGRFISSIGNHFSFFAQSVAAYLFTGNLTAVGMLWLVRGIASVLLIPIGGILTDRFYRKEILLTTDILLGVMTFCFVFVDSENQFWLLPLLAFFTQAIQRLHDPAAKASFKGISAPTPLKISGSVSALLSQMAVILGPLLAGVLFFITNESLKLLFILDSLTFFISVCFLLKVDFVASEPVTQNKQIRGMFSDGLRFLFQRKEVRSLLLLIFPIAWSGKLFDVLVLELSRRLTDGSLHPIGLLLAIFAAGGIVGSLLIPKLHDRIRPIHLVKFSGFILCFLLIMVGTFLTPASILLFSFSFGVVLTFTVTLLQIVIQEQVDDAYIGRVFASWSLIAVTGGGIGALLIGYLLDSLLIQTGLILISVVTIIPFVLLTFRFPRKTHQRVEEFF